MDYISQSPIQCSKGNLKCVLKCNKFPEKKAVDICIRQTWCLFKQTKGDKKFQIPNFQLKQIK